jgi:DNA-3-methyladenine glycosylase II
MWHRRYSVNGNWTQAQNHLRRTGPIMRGLIKRVGPCRLSRRRDHFTLLCVAIFNQQISMTVAEVLFGRFSDCFPRKRPTPAAVIEMLKNEAAVRRCGLSRQKQAYLKDLAERFLAGHIPARGISRLSDDQIIEMLTQVKGIGRWTAEMFLMFVLNRPDVWPVDDLGLRKAVGRAFAMKSVPSIRTVRRLGEQFRPWRTVATWYLWRGTEDR